MVLPVHFDAAVLLKLYSHLLTPHTVFTTHSLGKFSELRCCQCTLMSEEGSMVLKGTLALPSCSSCTHTIHTLYHTQLSQCFRDEMLSVHAAL